MFWYFYFILMCFFYTKYINHLVLSQQIIDYITFVLYLRIIIYKSLLFILLNRHSKLIYYTNMIGKDQTYTPSRVYGNFFYQFIVEGLWLYASMSLHNIK